MITINAVTYSRRYLTQIRSRQRINPQKWASRQRLLVPRHQQPSMFHSTARAAAASQKDFQLFDSLSETYKALPSSNETEKSLAWYTCGPTTYAPAHLGHARTYVCLDIVRRVLEHHLAKNGKAPPLFVMNITDIDDKILAAAKEGGTGESPLALARRFEVEFWKDLDALHCLRPHVVARVSEHVDSDVVPYIARLCDSGMAYESDDGVYFNLRAYEEKLGKVTKYGKLAPPSAASDFFSLDEDTSSTRKNDPRDFVLWKKRKDGEDMHWESPWGQGRPGWHIECSAMIEAVSIAFQETHIFQFHAGGVDLKFPHHANEIAQSEAYHGDALLKSPKEWIPHWVHTGHLHIDGLKMSKSLKNFVTIEDLLEEKSSSSLTSPSDDFRLWCLGLAGSYRGSATYSRDRIDAARDVREKLVKFLLDGSEWLNKSGDTTSKKWTLAEHAFYNKTNESFQKAHDAMMNDLDGNTFVRELVLVAETGGAYLRSNTDCPTEPMKNCLATLRDSLSLVGFSEKTTQAGLSHVGADATSQGIAGGERALIEELVKFRTHVRNAALTDARVGAATDSVKEILRLCDETRDDIFPAIGLEIADSKNEGDNPWRYCLPREKSVAEKGTTTHVAAPIIDVPLEDFFKVGQYEGMFTHFDKDGVPLTDANGLEISNRLLKKLLKKRQKYQRKLEGKK